MTAMVQTEATRTWADFDEFVIARAPALWRSAWLLTGDGQRAEDLVQDALSRCWTKFDRLNRAGDSFEAYVRTSIYHGYLAWWRRGSWRESPSIEPPAQERTDRPADRDLLRALAELPRQQRACIVLRYFEDRTVEDTAETLGISRGAVKQHTHRALAARRRSRHLTHHDRSFLPEEA